MFRDVLEKILLVGETLVARVAFEGLVCLVAAAVALEVGKLGEGFGTSDLGAAIGLISGVCSDVLLEMGQLGELPLTDLAAVGLDAQVDTGVLCQVRGVGEGFRALRAAVGLRLTEVNLGVELQVCFRAEHLK